MKISVEKVKAEDFKGDLLAVFKFEDGSFDHLKAIDKPLSGVIKKWAEHEDFKSAAGEILEIQIHGQLPAHRLLIVGLGKRAKFDLELLRQAAGNIAKRSAGKAKQVGVVLDGLPTKVSPEAAAEAVIVGASLGNYHFGKYFKEDKKKLLDELVLLSSAKTFARVSKGAERGQIVAEAVMAARDLVNEPSSELTPAKFAQQTKELLTGLGLTIKILEKPEIEKLGMGAFLAVAKGSHQPPRFIHVTYKPSGTIRRTQGKKPKKIALVGKGITFDTGGISIKPSSSMASMKMDMAGAAAVVATIMAAAKLKPKVEIHAITALTENMPGGGAYKPDDIVRALNGKSIEIGDTDAEGRVTLADSLSYAVSLKPDEIIDLATLTGAAAVALGNEIAAVMGRGGEPEKILKAAKAAGEEMWPMPLPEFYREQNKSQWADVKNIPSSRYGGAITAGLFLSEFVDPEIAWAHIDIAGPAWTDADKHYLTKEGTGFGVRTLIAYLSSI